MNIPIPCHRLLLIPVITAMVSANLLVSAPQFKTLWTTYAVGHPFVADVDGDGSDDMILHVHIDDYHIKDPSREPGIYYFTWPDRKPGTIFRGPLTGDRIDGADINGDGLVDLISGRVREDKGEDVCWYENPGPAAVAEGVLWKEHRIGDIPDHIKDNLCGDVDGNGTMDIVARSHTLSRIYYQMEDGWVTVQVDHPKREGMDIADLDLDGDLDLILNGFWIETPDDVVNGEYIKHDIDNRWYTQSTGTWQDNACSVVVGDVDQDGLPDVFIAHSEIENFPITRYSVESVEHVRTGPWKAQTVAPRYDWCETLDLGDVDNDGDLDLLAAKFERHSPKGTPWSNEPPYPVSLFINNGMGTSWERVDLAQHGVYAAKFGDLGGDGDLDIVGPQSYFRGPVYVWENQSSENKLSLTHWQHILVDDSRGRFSEHGEPAFLRYFGLDARDMDSDGDLDLVSGRYVYRNPGGTMEEAWPRFELNPPTDAFAAMCVDGDEFPDVVGMSLPDIYWMEATDAAWTSWSQIKIGEAPPTGHTNSQGYATAQIVPGGKEELVLSTEEGVFYWVIQEDPSQPWKRTRITPDATDEGVALADIDGDGWVDLAASRNSEYVGWWKNPGDGSADWKGTIVASGFTWPPDRIAIADLNGDKRPDIVITQEEWRAQHDDTQLVWFAQPENPSSENWASSVILAEYSLNNLDVGDFDRDGDVDVVTNEHKGPELKTHLFENDGSGNFTDHIIERGIESHLGTRAWDLDGDGDLDLVSIAWDNWQLLHVWRNDGIE